jgi:UTP-glucose-1-phosphate uridylyltransferase
MIRKAIISVTRLGFQPATKAQTRDMLSVVDKPVIQYVVGRSDNFRDMRCPYIVLLWI